jgi:MUN domain
MIEDLRGEMIVPPAKKLEDLIHLAELCVDLLQQNEEHYAEVSTKNYAVAISFHCGLLFYDFLPLTNFNLNHSFHLASNNQTIKTHLNL